MKITPLKINAVIGQTIQILVNDFASKEDWEKGLEVSASVSNILGDFTLTKDETSLTWTVSAEVKGVGDTQVTITPLFEGGTSMTCSVHVLEALKELTVDGSGTGQDTYIFGRQYIINQNLLTVNSLVEDVQQLCNEIKIITIVSGVASLAGQIAELAVLSKNILSKVQSIKGFNECHITWKKP